MDQYIPEKHVPLKEAESYSAARIKRIESRNIKGLTGPYSGVTNKNHDCYYNEWYFIWDTTGLSRVYIAAVSKDFQIKGFSDHYRNRPDIKPEPDHVYMIAI